MTDILETDILSMFHTDDSIRKAMQHIVGTSLIDALFARKKKEEYMSSFVNHQIPTDLLYKIGSHLFNDLWFSLNSPYSMLSIAEMVTLGQNAEIYAKYCRDTVVDIGCGNGKKAWFLMKKIHDASPQARAYIWYEWSAGALKLADDTMDAMRIPSLTTDFVLGDGVKGLANIAGPKTILFMGGTFSNLSLSDQQVFLRKCAEQMSVGDTLIINAFVEEHIDTWPIQISDEKLKQLQDEFVIAEKQRLQTHKIWDQEKQTDVSMLQQAGVDIGPADIDYDLIWDADRQLLIDRKIYHRDLYADGELILEKWSYDTSGIPLDRNFFVTHVQDAYKNMMQSCYASADSDRFIYHILKRFGLGPENSLISYMYRDGSLHIDLTVTKDTTLYIFDEPLQVTKGEVFTILDSKRQENDALLKQFDAAWLVTQENFPVVLQEPIYPHRKYNVMRSYVLQKK